MSRKNPTDKSLSQEKTNETGKILARKKQNRQHFGSRKPSQQHFCCKKNKKKKRQNFGLKTEPAKFWLEKYKPNRQDVCSGKKQIKPAKFLLAKTKLGKNIRSNPAYEWVIIIHNNYAREAIHGDPGALHPGVTSLPLHIF